MKRSFDSVAEIAGEVRINVSQFSSPLLLSGNSSLLNSFYSEGSNVSITGRPTST